MTSSDKKKLVMICIDSSQYSSRAFDWYIHSIHQNENIIGLVHIQVVNLPSDTYSHRSGTSESYHEAVQQSVIQSKAIVEHYKNLLAEKGIDVENNVKVFLKGVVDSVGHTICTVAKENNASLIVIGQRGLGAFRRTLFGSVSDYVLHHADTAVAIVPS